jgi:serine/threonine-protein kinase
MEDYVEICFEIGKLYWYYYDYGDSSNNQATRAKSAVKWFQIVTSNADDDYENLAMAKVYANIGIFYRDITTNVSEASDKGKYLPFYNDLNTLIDTVASDENESEIVRLELIEASRSALQRYATKFKIDGVSKSDMTAFYDKLEQCLDMIEVYEDDTDDIITVKKNETLEQMDETKREINLAYETTKDGD